MKIFTGSTRRSDGNIYKITVIQYTSRSASGTLSGSFRRNVRRTGET